MIEFFMPLKSPPTATHQMKKINWAARTFYEPDEVKAARAMLTAHMARHRPHQPLEGPIRLTVKWLYPGRRDGAYKMTRPDLDNSQKLLMDCMTDLGFWKDDAQVASLIAEKFFNTRPGIYIKVEQL